MNLEDEENLEELGQSRPAPEDGQSSVSSLREDEQLELNISGSTQNSAETQTQQETTGDGRKDTFRSMPILNGAFNSLDYDKNRNRIVSCKFCPYTATSNRLFQLANHIRHKCRGISESERAIFIETADKESALKVVSFHEQFNTLLATVMTKNRIAFKLLECPLFAKLITFLNKQARVVSRQEMSSRYVAQLALNVEKRFLDSVKSGAHYAISIEFDHWTDFSGRLTLGVVATSADGSRYLVTLEDVSLQGHYSSVLVEILRKCLSRIPSRSINAIISDSASTCRKAKRILVKDQDYKHVIQQRCLAHFVNSIGDNFCKKNGIRETMDTANGISGLASNSQALSAKLVAIGKRKVSTATAVRWYSHVSMLESLLEAREEVEQHFTDYKGRKQEVISFIYDSSFWMRIEHVIRIMRPLAHCIATAELADGCLGETMKGILDLVKSLYESDWNDSFIVAALQSFFLYFNEEKFGRKELGILVSAYFLDRRYKMDYIAVDGLELVIETLVDLLVQSGFSSALINSVLYPEFKSFHKQHAPFNKPARPDQTPLEWWNDLPDTGVLRRIAIRLATLKPSSANIERVFSVIKLLQSPTRTNFHLKTVENIARLKLSLTQDEDDNYLYGQLSNLGISRRSIDDNLIDSQSSLDEEEERPSSRDNSSQGRSSSCSQISFASPTPRSAPNKRRRSLPTQVEGQTSGEQNSISVNSSQESFDQELVAKLGFETYHRLKAFDKLFDFKLINESGDGLDSNNNPEESTDQIQAELAQMKSRFMTDLRS